MTVNVPRLESMLRLVAVVVFLLGALGKLPVWGEVSQNNFALLLGLAFWCASYAVPDFYSVFKLPTSPK